MKDPRTIKAGESPEAAGMTVREVLERFHEEAGFSTDLIGVEHSDPGALARVGRFIASSVSSTSQVLGTGGPSTSLSF